jgi:hypothetical protein
MTIKNSLNHELSVPTAMVIANILKVRNQKNIHRHTWLIV